MTKESLKEYLEKGLTMLDLFEFRPGQECEIFKASHFEISNDICYIPDLYLNEIPLDNPITDPEQIEEVVSCCYDGNDFMEICEGDDEVAEALFYFCDWQHPSSAYDEGFGEDFHDEEFPEEPADGWDETHIITEMCSYCGSEIEMRWAVNIRGYQAFCPVCGKRLMLCDECRHTEGDAYCDYDRTTNSCRRMHKPEGEQMYQSTDLRVETPLGAIIVRINNNPKYPGVWIDLRRTDADQDMPLALVEFCCDEADLPDGQPNLITRVWGDGMQDDFTDRIVHKGIEEYFRIEE